MIIVAIKHYLIDKAIQTGFEKLIGNFMSLPFNVNIENGNEYAALTYVDFCADGTEFKVTCTGVYDCKLQGQYFEFRSRKSYFQFNSSSDMDMFIRDYLFDINSIMMHADGCNFTCVRDMYTGILVKEILDIY
jgi:hypothetical protein